MHWFEESVYYEDQQIFPKMHGPEFETFLFVFLKYFKIMWQAIS